MRFSIFSLISFFKEKNQKTSERSKHYHRYTFAGVSNYLVRFCYHHLLYKALTLCSDLMLPRQPKSHYLSCHITRSLNRVILELKLFPQILGWQKYWRRPLQQSLAITVKSGRTRDKNYKIFPLVEYLITYAFLPIGIEYIVCNPLMDQLQIAIHPKFLFIRTVLAYDACCKTGEHCNVCNWELNKQLYPKSSILNIIKIQLYSVEHMNWF